MDCRQDGRTQACAQCGFSPWEEDPNEAAGINGLAPHAALDLLPTCGHLLCQRCLLMGRTQMVESDTYQECSMFMLPHYFDRSIYSFTRQSAASGWNFLSGADVLL